MKFKKKAKVSTEIPTASMPDIVFMLLLFFMVSTVFRQSVGFPINLPTAMKIKKLEAKKNVAVIWVNAKGDISIDDNLVLVKDVAPIINKKLHDNKNLIISFKSDKNTRMGLVNDIQNQLRKAGALRMNYCAKYGST